MAALITERFTQPRNRRTGGLLQSAWPMVLWLTAMAVLSGCGRSEYAYAGRYALTAGPHCEVLPGASAAPFIEIGRVPKGAGEGERTAPRYWATLVSEQGGTFPTHSGEAVVDDDGGLSLSFVRAGAPGFFVNLNGIESTLVLRPKDAQHLWLTAWTFKETESGSNAVLQTGDLLERIVQAAAKTSTAKPGSNAAKMVKTDQGICLVRMDATPTP